MKTLTIILSLISLNAFASNKECTDTLNLMTKLTYDYIEVMKGCKTLETTNDSSGRAYEGYRRIARKTEEIHQQVQDLCHRVCDDTFFCEGGKLSGACSK